MPEHLASLTNFPYRFPRAVVPPSNTEQHALGLLLATAANIPLNAPTWGSPIYLGNTEESNRPVFSHPWTKSLLFSAIFTLGTSAFAGFEPCFGISGYRAVLCGGRGQASTGIPLMFHGA